MSLLKPDLRSQYILLFTRSVAISLTIHSLRWQANVQVNIQNVGYVKGWCKATQAFVSLSHWS